MLHNAKIVQEYGYQYFASLQYLQAFVGFMASKLNLSKYGTRNTLLGNNTSEGGGMFSYNGFWYPVAG